MKVLFGGYTDHASHGLYEAFLDQQNPNPSITNLKNIIQLQRPTYFQTDGSLLFTISQNDNQAGIASYRLIGQNYVQIDAFYHPGAAPCYLALSKNKKLIYTANYHLGTLSIFQYDEQGHLQFISSCQHTGHGKLKEQDAAHPHFFNQTPQGNLVSCDLGLDRLDFYTFYGQQLKHVANYQMEAGFGTRHVRFSVDGHYMYVVGELSSKVNVIQIDETNWNFAEIDSVKTIPESYSEHNGAAAIRISNDDKFLYVTNRGHDSIAIYRILANHHLDLIQRIPVYGAFPRDFNFNSQQNLLVVANQNSNNATLYKRNPKLGTLVPIQKDFYVPEPTRVIILD